jgi:hypothetical protein
MTYQRGSLPRPFRSCDQRDLILWTASRLYAFSGYLNQT